MGVWSGTDVFDKEYDIAEVIKKDSHSKVSRVVHRRTERVYAAKLVHGATQEGKLLSKSTNCEGVVEYHAHFSAGDKSELILTEWVGGGELFDAVKLSCFGNYQAWSIGRQLFTAVSHLHNLGIVHRDIKLENILLTTDGDAKLIDFGMSVQIGNSACLSSCCGSGHYMAPDILLTRSGHRKRYGKEVDVWAAGVVLYVLLFKKYPFASPADNNKSSPSDIITAAYHVPADADPNAVDLLAKIFTIDPSNRITANEVIHHQYFAADNCHSQPS